METPEEAEKAPTEEISSVQADTGGKALDVLEGEDLDEELLIESDGDFFWVLQRVVWGTLKGLLLLGAIGFAIWFIWGGDQQPFKGDSEKIKVEEPSVPREKQDETKESVPERRGTTSLGSGEISQSVSRIVWRAYELDEARIIKSSGTINESIRWLKWAKALGEVSTEVLRMEESVIRAQKIEQAIVEADQALEVSQRLQKELNAQIADLTLKKNNLVALVEETDNEIFGDISRFDPNRIDALLAQKISYQKDLAAVVEEGKIRETLLRNIQNFDLLLRTKRIPLVRPTEMIGIN